MRSADNATVHPPAASPTPSVDPVAAPPWLHTRGLACRRGGRRVFANLTLAMRPGQGVWLRGPNGCGKTSLLRLLAGLGEADEGEIGFEGQPVRALPAASRGRLRYLGHANALNGGLRVGEALTLLLDLANAVPREGSRQDARMRLTEALARMGVADAVDRPVARLSQGQQRRAALARLMLDDEPCGPCLWLLDEPLDALDDDGAQAFGQWLDAHLARGGAVLMTGHASGAMAGLPLLEWRWGETVPAELGA